MVVPIGKESPGLWVDVSICEPELSVAVGAVQDIVPVAIPLSVLPDWLVGHPLMTGPSMSDNENKLAIKNISQIVKRNLWHTEINDIGLNP